MGLADWCWLLRHCETPLAGPEQYYKLAILHDARHAGDPFTVVLTGQGSDEFNGGYATGFAHTPPGGWAGFLDALDLGRHRHALDRLPGAVRALGGHLPERWLRTDWLRAQLPALPADPTSTGSPRCRRARHVPIIRTLCSTGALFRARTGARRARTIATTKTALSTRTIVAPLAELSQ